MSLPFASPQRRLSYIYFAGPRAAEAHLGTAGCHVGFLNFPRRRGCLTDHRRILRSYFTMTSTIASILKQKPRNSSCVSMAVSIKNRQLLALTAQGSADRRGSTSWPHTRRVMRLRAKTLESRCFRRKKRDEKEKTLRNEGTRLLGPGSGHGTRPVPSTAAGRSPIARMGPTSRQARSRRPRTRPNPPAVHNRAQDCRRIRAP